MKLIQSPLNYTGGKFKLLSQIIPYFPNNINTFVDLFCGGGNVGCNIDCNHVIFNDVESKVINLLRIFKESDYDNIYDSISAYIDKYELSWVSKNGYEYYNCESGKGVGSYNKDYFLKLRNDFNKIEPPFDEQYYILLYVLIVFSFNNQIRFNKDGYCKCPLLYENCTLTEISTSLIFKERKIIDGVNSDLGESITTIEEAYALAEDIRYNRFKNLIDSKFTDENLLLLLDKFDNRDDDEINNMVTDNADIPTIFEYILGIIWYKISNKEGRILDYMKLSLDAELLPISHAVGGEADIVYEYKETEHYKKHNLLLEATLADSTNQRRMEMEPVSRHLGNHLLLTRNLNSYCVFVTNNLNINVISDFRSRKHTIYCNNQDSTDYISEMKIIPLQTSDLRNIIKQRKKYTELFQKFEDAFLASEMHPKIWYDNWVKVE